MADKRFRFTKAEKEARALTDRKKEETIPLEDVQAIFDYYIQVLKAGSKRKPMLDAKRRRMLAIAIYDYDMDACRAAIDGCSNSHFHMGQNKAGKVYDSIELIFRDTEHIERFMGYNE